MDSDLDPLTAVMFGLGKLSTVINNPNSRIFDISEAEEVKPESLKNRPRKLAPYAAKRLDGRNTRELVSSLHNDGHTCEYIADRLKMTANNVRYHMKVLKLTPRYGPNKQAKPIVQQDINGTFINRFSSAREASRKTGISRSSIQDCCSGKIPSTRGFIFKYTESF